MGGSAYGINVYGITVYNGIDTYNYHMAFYRKYTDDYYDFNNINLGTMSNLMTFNRNTTSYAISLDAPQTDGTMYIFTDRDEYKQDWISITGQEGQEITGGYGISSEYGRIFGVKLNKGQNTILVSMNVIIWNQPVFNKTYTINFNVASSSDPDSSDGGCGGGGGGCSSEPTTPPVNTTIDPTTNTVVVSVSETQLASLFAMLQDNPNEVKLAIIKIPKVTGLNNYGIELPYSAFIASNSSGIRLETDIGTLTLMDTILQNVVQSTAQNVKFNMGYVNVETLDQETQTLIGDHPIIRLNMEVDGQTTEWNNPDSPIIVSVPYTPTAEELANPEKIVIYYIDGQGNVVTIPNGKYDAATGQVVFTTTHFSDYAVAFNNKQFTDIDNEIIEHAVEVLAAKRVINGKTSTEFKPNDTVTRAEFITMLVRAFELNADFVQNFSDVSRDKYYYNSIGIGKELGIINGVGDGAFAPNATLTPEQIKIILDNLNKVKGINTENINVNGSNRGDVAVVLYELMK